MAADPVHAPAQDVPGGGGEDRRGRAQDLRERPGEQVSTMTASAITDTYSVIADIVAQVLREHPGQQVDPRLPEDLPR